MKKLFLALLLIGVTLSGTKFLMPDEAFKPKISMDGNTPVISVVLGKDIYLYEEKFSVETESKDVKILKVDTIESTTHDGDQVFFKSPEAKIYFEKTSDVSGIIDVKLDLSYQGCSSAGLCYEPQDVSYDIKLDLDKLAKSESKPLKDLSSLNTVSSEVKTPAVAQESKNETDQIADIIKGGNIWIILLSFLGFGLLLSLTPCVFPMIPIISSVIVSAGKVTTSRAFFLSLVYVLAMSVAYTLAGVLAGLFGANLQAALQNAWVIGAFSFIFVALSLSMFGYYELQMPNFIQSKLSKTTQNAGGSIAGVAIMGFLSALIVGPCVAAPLAGALIYIGQSGDALLGGMALFAMSMGMGLPLLIVGTTSGKFMPRPGAWMDFVKYIFGIMLLGVAIWMLSRIVAPSVTLFLFGTLLLFTSVHFGAFEALERDGLMFKGANKKAFSIILFLASLSMFTGMVTGATNPFNPLENINKPSVSVASSAQNVPKLKYTKVNNLHDLDALVEKNKGKKIMIDFWASWCTSCKELEEVTFKDQNVLNALDDFVIIKADLSENTDDQKAMSKKYGVFGPPVLIFLDKDANEITSKRQVGYIEPEKFVEKINSL